MKLRKKKKNRAAKWMKTSTHFQKRKKNKVENTNTILFSALKYLKKFYR